MASTHDIKEQIASQIRADVDDPNTRRAARDADQFVYTEQPSHDVATPSIHVTTSNEQRDALDVNSTDREGRLRLTITIRVSKSAKQDYQGEEMQTEELQADLTQRVAGVIDSNQDVWRDNLAEVYSITSEELQAPRRPSSKVTRNNLDVVVHHNTSAS